MALPLQLFEVVHLFDGLDLDGIGRAVSLYHDQAVLVGNGELDAVLIDDGVLVDLKRIYQHSLLGDDQGISALDDLWSFTACKANKWYESPL